MWNLRQNGQSIPIRARDETLRDGNQGEAPRSAYRAVEHLLALCPHYDQMSIGWIYTNPSDVELARYLRQHGEELSEKKEGFSTSKFFVYSLVYRGKETEPSEIDSHSFFGKMLRDLETHEQPYGAVNVLTKGRVGDLKDFGQETDSERFRHDMVNTLSLLRKANADIDLELGIEHAFTAWTEQENQAQNREHIVNTIVDYLIAVGPGRRASISMADTDGAHGPEEIGGVITELSEALKRDPRLTEHSITFDPSMFVAHMHNDLENARNNTLAALKAGAGAFDSTVGRMGERKGNVTLEGMIDLLECDDPQALVKYQESLETVLGVRGHDKQMGGPDAFCAVGGMHADCLLKALREQQEHGITYKEFVNGYRGSYASVPADMFGQEPQVTLSPVAGAANVLFMLSSLGLHLNDKKDPRIGELLAEVKEDEYERGINYRGLNNANALLLLADKFGLREHDGRAGG